MDEDLSDITEESYPVDLFPHGCIVGIANLAEVFTTKKPPAQDHPMNESPWKLPNAGAWLYLTDMVFVQDVEFKGFVGLFKVPYDIAARLQPWPDAR